MSNDNAEKVMSLARKALSTQSVEEARTCALTAIQHIFKYKLIVVDPLDRPLPVPPKASKRAQRPAWRGPPQAPSRSSFSTTCFICTRPIHAGAQVFWSPAFKSSMCALCYESEILGY